MTKGELLERIKDYPDNATVLIVANDGKCNDIDEIYRPTVTDNEIQLFPYPGRQP